MVDEVFRFVKGRLRDRLFDREIFLEVEKIDCVRNYRKCRIKDCNEFQYV